jgi:hypothetical protein
MNNPLELSLSQSFERERFLRVIEESNDIKQLKEISKVLLNGWFTQKAAAQWIMREALNSQKHSFTPHPNGHQHT